MDLSIWLKATVGLPLIFLVPGLIIINSTRFPTKIKDLSFLERLLLEILVSVVTAGWVGLTLAEIGRFSFITLSGVLLVLSVIAMWIFRPKLKMPSRFTVRFEQIFIVALVILAAALFFHPSQEITGRHDIGVYIATGVNIARTGSITINDDLLREVPEALKSSIYLIFDRYPENQRGAYSDGMLFPDFSIVDKSAGVVVPFQPPLQQIWVGMFFSMFGLEGSLYANTIFGLLSLLFVFMLTKLIFDSRVATIASTLLSVNFLQVFFSQYSSPEIVFQFLFFSGIAAIVLFIRTRDAILGVVSAMALGELLFTRIDALLLVLMLPLLSLYMQTSGISRRRYSYFGISFLALSLQFLTHVNQFLRPYLFSVFSQTLIVYQVDMDPVLVGFSFSFLILAANALSFCFVSAKRIGRFCLSLKRTIPVCLTILFVATICYYLLTSPTNAPFEGAKQFVLIWRGDADPLFALAWFMTPLGVTLALLGIVLALYNPHKERYLFLALVAPFLVVYLYTLPVNPAFPWAMRRLITVVVPSIVIFCSYAIVKIKEWSIHLRLAKIAPTAFLLVLIVSSASMDRTLLTPQFEDFIPQTSQIASYFDQNSIVLDANRYTDTTISLPLKFIYGVNATYVWTDSPDPAEFVEIIRIWNREGKAVYLMVYPQSRYARLQDQFSPYIEFEYVKTFLLNVSKLEWEWYSFSNKRSIHSYEVKIYKLTARDAALTEIRTSDELGVASVCFDFTRRVKQLSELGC